MATRCFGRRGFAAGIARAFAFSGLRDVDFAAGLRAGDFFCAAVRAAARDVGFCLAIYLLPVLREEASTKSRSVGWAKRNGRARVRSRAHQLLWRSCPRMVGTARRRAFAHPTDSC